MKKNVVPLQIDVVHHCVNEEVDSHIDYCDWAGNEQSSGRPIAVA